MHTLTLTQYRRQRKIDQSTERLAVSPTEDGAIHSTLFDFETTQSSAFGIHSRNLDSQGLIRILLYSFESFICISRTNI